MLVIGFPWVILLMDDNPLGAFFAIMLQATVIGWIPASMWAHRIAYQSPAPKTKKKSKTNTTTALKEE